MLGVVAGKFLLGAIRFPSSALAVVAFPDLGLDRLFALRNFLVGIFQALDGRTNAEPFGNNSLLGIEPPKVVDGHKQDPIDGVSFACTFDSARRVPPWPGLVRAS